MSGHSPWLSLRKYTIARIALGRCGAGMPTSDVLQFMMAHALARDAVHAPMNWDPVETGLRAAGFLTTKVESAALSREEYLQRPDLGRKLSDVSKKLLSHVRLAEQDLAIVVGDGLSSIAVMANTVLLLEALKPYLTKLTVAPIVLANQCRVALGDEVGECLNAKAVLMLIGERPGLSSPDSLGAYLTWAPRIGRKDAERNCVSNIRLGGLEFDEAAFKLSWLLNECFTLQLSGINLKDRSPPRAAVERVRAAASIEAR